MEYTRAVKNYGGSASPKDAEIPRKFVLKEKTKEMLKYALPLLDGFPRRNRRLADTLRDAVLEMLTLSIELEKHYIKKTTARNYDVKLAVIKEFVVLASDRDYCGSRYAPPLTIHQRDVWSRMNDELGCLIGGCLKQVAENATTAREGES